MAVWRTALLLLTALCGGLRAEQNSGWWFETRQRFQLIDNPDLRPADTLSLYQHHYLAGLQYDSGPWRLQAELLGAWEHGRPGKSSAVEENRFDVHQLLVGYRITDDWRVDFGRRELALGSERLVGERNGTNVRRRFDGLRLRAGRSGGGTLDLLALKPVASEPGTLDDGTDQDRFLGGLYWTQDVAIHRTGRDFYYLYFQDDEAVFATGSGHERRHTLGSRLFGSWGGWDWNWEAFLQTGRFTQAHRSLDIRAWSIATDTGYTFASPVWRPRLGLSINVASGDDDPGDGNLNTFNPLFPRGNYFSEAAVFGPRNFYNIHGFVSIRPADGWRMGADYNVYWRLQSEDAVYGPPGNRLLGPVAGGSLAGRSLSLNLSRQLDPQWTAAAVYTRLSPGDIFRRSGPSVRLNFLELTLEYRHTR